MSIRFRCDKCSQKLRVGDDKAGLQAKCPKCKACVTVPTHSPVAEEPGPTGDEPPSPAHESITHESTAHEPTAHESTAHESVPRTSPDSQPAPAVRRDAADEMMLPEIVIRDDSEDWVSESAPGLRTETMIDYDKVAVPRRILYLQGALLGIVALVSFVLGMLIRGGVSPRDSAGKLLEPCILSGQITYEGNDQSRPDGGSVVIVLPVDRRPAADSRVAIEGLRPGDPVPADGNISLRTIRSLGGDFVRANDQGNYQVRLPEQGRYHVLVISRRAARSGSDRLEVSDVAQIGRYFANVVELLDDRKYQWRTLTVRGDTTMDATF